VLKILSISATLSFLFMSGAMAASGGVGACVADIKKVCGSIEPGGRRIATCLKERLLDLSDVCKARVAEVAAAGKTCRADVEKQCGTKTRRAESDLHQGCPHQFGGRMQGRNSGRCHS
jgi:hypothetical protein